MLAIISLGLICLDWYDWNNAPSCHNIDGSLVGIDLSWLIRLKRTHLTRICQVVLMLGLICLDWYDWNLGAIRSLRSGNALLGLICLDWYDWNLQRPARQITEQEKLGLICFDWYDWNALINTATSLRNNKVGIDLSWFIRLKQGFISSSERKALIDALFHFDRIDIIVWYFLTYSFHHWLTWSTFAYGNIVHNFHFT